MSLRVSPHARRKNVTARDIIHLIGVVTMFEALIQEMHDHDESCGEWERIGYVDEWSVAQAHQQAERARATIYRVQQKLFGE